MSSIVTSILSSTVGLLWNKSRDSTAAKLKDGDVTDAKIREIVVRELNDIKTKLDGLSRKDLLSSYSFLQEGVDFLNVSLNKSKLEQKALMNETQDDRGETSTMAIGAESCILNEALELSHAMGKLKIHSDEEFESAKKRFEEARKTATHAFCNEALSVKDRIFAAKVRIVSEILECLDRSETAITGCLSFLKKLHSLPAIQEIFTVYINGGVKSILNKAERVENVKSIMLINYVLFHYVSKFSSEQSMVLTWPTIDLAGRSFNPILSWQEVSTRKSMEKELPNKHPSELMFDEEIFPRRSAVNSQGDVIIAQYRREALKIISKTGSISKVVELPEPREGKFIAQCIAGIAVDNNNKVYVVRYVETRTENGDVRSHVLYVLDENYHVRLEWVLDFLKKRVVLHEVTLAINTNNNIIMIQACNPHVYICDNNGKIKHKFEHDSGWADALSISGRNEIMMSSDDLKAVHICSVHEEGNLKSTIILPEGHRVRKVAFHYVICKIIVLTYVGEKDSYFILCYTEGGELETSAFFYKKLDRERDPALKSHPSGPVAVVRETSITFI